MSSISSTSSMRATRGAVARRRVRRPAHAVARLLVAFAGWHGATAVIAADAGAAADGAAAAPAVVAPLDVDELAPGVFVHVGAVADWTPEAGGDVANLGFVVGRRCVAVIDTGGTPAVGRALRAAVARTTPLPVCYVVNTHAHPDHVLGNAAFTVRRSPAVATGADAATDSGAGATPAAAAPGASATAPAATVGTVGTSSTAGTAATAATADIAGTAATAASADPAASAAAAPAPAAPTVATAAGGVNARSGGQGPTFVASARFARKLAQREPYDRQALQRDFGVAPAEAVVVYPTTEVERTLDLDLGDRVLTLRAWPTAHTDNDLTVYDRRTRTLFASDLLFVRHLPVLDGNLRGWLEALAELRCLDVATVVPGHGAPGRDWPGAADAETAYLGALLRDTRAALRDGLTIQQAVDRVPVGGGEGDWRLTERFHRRNVTTAYAELEWEDDAARARPLPTSSCEAPKRRGAG